MSGNALEQLEGEGDTKELLMVIQAQSELLNELDNEAVVLRVVLCR